MKRKVFTFLLMAIIGVTLMAQKPTGVVKKTTTAPVIDGTIDEIWATANSYDIDKIYREETPSVGGFGETTWKALYDDDGIYVLVTVMDDVWSPVFTGAVPGSAWLYDKPEVYFDVNAELEDGKGAQTDGLGLGNGHYQFAPSPIDGEIDGTTSGSGTDNHDQPYGWKVNDPDYSVEYFVPFSMLLDGDGTEVDKTKKIGFDVTVIDNDDNAAAEPIRNRAVWANIGTFDESWTNMDECGTITLEGLYVSGISVTSITVTSSASTIETNAGTLQMTANVLPADASVKDVKWSVVDGTGKATISATGLLKAFSNGTVTVNALAKDGSGITGSKEITISNQGVTLMSLSLIKDGGFDTDGAIKAPWGTWSDNGGTVEIIGGVCTMMPAVATDGWHLQVTQTGWEAYNDSTYVLTFTAWADEERTFVIDFEDDEAHGYNRFGTSEDPESNGTCEWTVPVTWEPTTFTFTTTLTGLDETSTTKVGIFTSNQLGTVYLDDISIVKIGDLAKLTNGVHSKYSSNVKIYPNPAVNELNISLAIPDSKVAIYNSLGSKMDEVIVKGTQARLDISGYAKGLYFVKINNETVRKFVK